MPWRVIGNAVAALQAQMVGGQGRWGTCEFFVYDGRGAVGKGVLGRV